MNVRLSEQHLRDRSEFVDFVRRHVAPVAQAMDDDERLFPGVMEALADAGYFGAIVPSKYGGRAMDAVSAGLLVEAVAAVSPSVASVVTVNWMVAESLLRFGTESQRERWLPGIAAGKQLASFALSEPEIGSDARGVTSRAERTADGFRLSGSKTWITGARIASIALVIVQCDGEPTAVMVDLKSPDVCIEPVEGLLGHRSSMLGTVSLRGCEVGKDAVVGKAGAGVDFIAQSALHIDKPTFVQELITLFS